MSSEKLHHNRAKDTCPLCLAKAHPTGTRRITKSPPLYRSQWTCKNKHRWTLYSVNKPGN